MRDQVVIFGSKGFIGSGLKDHLNSNGFNVIGVSRQDYDFLNSSEFTKKGTSIIQNSILIYAAGKHRQHGDTLDLYKDNIEIILNLLQAANKAPPKRIIFLSSMEVYGRVESGQHVTEKTKITPDSFYAAGKFAQEQIFQVWARSKNIPVTCLRLPGIYGVNDQTTSVISKIFNSTVNKTEFMLSTDGNEERDYISIGDLTACITALILSNNIPSILNIGSGCSVSINFLIGLIENLTRNKVKLRQVNPGQVGFDIQIDTSLLRANLPDFKFMTIEQGVAKYINEYNFKLQNFVNL